MGAGGGGGGGRESGGVSLPDDVPGIEISGFSDASSVVLHSNRFFVHSSTGPFTHESVQVEREGWQCSGCVWLCLWRLPRPEGLPHHELSADILLHLEA